MIVSVCGVLLAGALLSQSAGDTRRSVPPRTSWGDPNLGGLWDHRSPLAIERPDRFVDRATLELGEFRAWLQEKFERVINEGRGEDAVEDVNQGHNAFWFETRHDLVDDLRTSLLVDPANGKLPALTRAAQRAVDDAEEQPSFPFRGMNFPFEDPLLYLPAGPEETGLTERCIVGYGGPPIYSGVENQNLRIVQTPGDVLLFHEDMRTPRIVRMTGGVAPHEPRRLVGVSVGSWVEDTLVVVTTHFSDDRPSYWDPRHGPVGKGSELTLVERFRRVAEHRLEYEYTVVSPENYESDFTVRIPMRRAKWKWYEYSCHERNESLWMTLKGARYLESLRE